MRVGLVYGTIEGIAAGGLCRDRIASVQQGQCRACSGCRVCQGAWNEIAKIKEGAERKDSAAVSYTHLTLPTIYSV